MTGDGSVDDTGVLQSRVGVVAGRRRPRLPVPRGHRVVVRLSDEERADVVGGAARLGLSVGAFLSAAGVAVARNGGVLVDADAATWLAVPASPRAADAGLAEGAAARVRGGRGSVDGAGGVGLDRRTGDAIDDLETQLGRVGNLLNQAVRVLHSTGEVDGRLLGAADAVRRLTVRVDAVLDGVRLARTRSRPVTIRNAGAAAGGDRRAAWSLWGAR